MTLLEIRQNFIKLTGRYDLATDTGSILADVNAGADFYINAGSRWLDLEQETQEDIQSYYKSLAVSEYNFSVANCRAISKIMIVTDDDGEVELDYKPYNDFITYYPLLSATEGDTPICWTLVPPATSRASNDPSQDVIIMPPPSVAMSVKVYGLFFSKALTINEDENYWSINFPDVLLAAAIRKLEGFNRNTQGVRDMEGFITSDLKGIDKDLASWSAASNLRMEG